MATSELPFDVTEAEVEEKAKLQRHFGRFDILFFLVCTIVGVDTIGTVAAKGGVAFTWIIVLAAVFFIPSALLFAELGTAFPEEGGPYLWTRLAFGHLVGAVNNFLYWVTNPVWLGGTLAVLASTTVAKFFTSSESLPTVWFYVFTLAFVWVGVLSAILSFRVGKWVPTVGAWSRFVLLGFFTISVVVYAAEHGFHGIGGGDFNPFGGGTTAFWAGFLTLLPVLLFNFVGFELPSSAGDEMTDPQKDIPYGIARSAVLSVLLYGLPILGVLIVLPTDQVTGLGGFIDAIKAVFTVYGGSVTKDGTTLSGAGLVLGDAAAILFILSLLSSGVTWIMGSDRALAVSGFEGGAPRALGVISTKYGTPVRVNLLSGIVATAVLVAAHEITGGNAQKFFTAVLGLAVSTTLMSYLGIFPALVQLRRRLPAVARPYRSPAAGFLSGWLTLLILLATVQLLAPGLGLDWFGADFRPMGWEAGEHWTYLATELVPLVVFVALGVLFWALGKPTREHIARRADVSAQETPAT
ncbi:MAG TPA: APC family permease [Kineosporiaceae bacterium]|nr:APC family permease [Kineosporiaceae bacterium]